MRPIAIPSTTRLSQSPWYRYLFFGWLFRDVNVGSLFERAAAWRHNCEQAKWLATYMRRWVVLGLLFYGMGALAELIASESLLPVFLYVPSVISVPVNAVLGAAWLGFKALPPPI